MASVAKTFLSKGTAMKILSISDLHLGDGSGTDDFQYKTSKSLGDTDGKLIAWIQSLRVDKVVINGDLYENWQCTMPSIRRAHKKLLDYIAAHKKKFIIITGNHDYTPAGKFSYARKTDNGKKVVFEHGFQNDKNMRNPIVRFLVWVAGIGEKLLPNADDLAYLFVKHGSLGKINRLTEAYAQKLADTYDIIILGHTHTPCIKKIKSATKKRAAVYANDGTCQHGKLEGVILNTKTGAVSAVKK